MAIARALFAHPVLALLALLGITAAGVWYAKDSRIQTGLKQMLPMDSEVKIIADRVSEQFVSDNVAFIIYEGGDVFSQRRLQATRALVEALEQLSLPGATDADEPLYLVEDALAITNVDDLVGKDGELRTVPLVPDPVPSDRAALEAIRARAKANPLIHQQLLAPTDDAGLILVRLPFDLVGDQQGKAVIEIQTLLASTLAADPSVQFYLTGEPVWRRELTKFINKANTTLFPLQYVVVFLLMIVFLRSWRGVAVVLATVTINVVVTMGILAAIGGTLNSSTAALPTVMLALSVAMTLHFFSELGKRVGTSDAPDIAERNLAALLSPVFMATVTTAAGFASLASGELAAVDELAYAGAGGVSMALIITALVYTCATSWTTPSSLVAPKGLARSQAFGGMLDHVASFVIGRYRLVCAAFVVLTILLVVAIPKVRFDVEWTAFFRKHVKARVDTEHAQAPLGGTWQVTISLQTDEPGRFTRPEEHAKIRALEKFLRDDIGANRVTSLVDFLAIMNREMHGRPADDLRTPATAEQAAQLLLLNSSDTLEQYVDGPRKWARVESRQGIVGSKGAGEKYAVMDAYLEKHFPRSEGYVAHATGGARTSTEIGNYLLSDQTSSLTIACLIVLLCMFVLFRSLRTGLFCMIPNFLPVVAIFGLMGWFDIPLDNATILTSSIAVGIAVDDTVHFVDYLRERLRAGADIEQAIRDTFRLKGPAMLWTTIVLTLGFSVLAFGELAGTAAFGLLLGAGMITALIGDFLLLPAVILLVGSRLGVPNHGPETDLVQV